jgi:hypothetical protein
MAVLLAVWIPAWQRRNSRRDASDNRVRQEKEHLKRLSTGLRAEINAALEWAHRRQQALGPVLKGLQDARAKGAVVRREPIQPGSIVVTDAIVSNGLNPEIARLQRQGPAWTQTLRLPRLSAKVGNPPQADPRSRYEVSDFSH